MSERYRLELLGHPRVLRVTSEGGTVEVTWRLRRALEIVAFLALANDHRATRDELVESLWSGHDAEAVRRNFHPTMSSARRTLAGQAFSRRDGSAVIHQQGVYLLDPEVDWWVDTSALDTALHDGRARLREAGSTAASTAKRELVLTSWQGAWRLYRGPLLNGFDGAWIDPRREHLRRLYLRLLGGIGELAVELERYELGLDAYRSVLLEEPFEERIHVAVMEIFAGQGRRDLVRKQYVRLQDLLKELNVEPLEATQERYHELMR